MNSIDFQQTGLVLEGGGMRGVFTSGVLDYFMDNAIRFPYAIGVSAGGSNGLSYASNQRGRAKFCNIDALVKHRYIGLKYLPKQHSIMDMKFLFGKLPLELYPFDFSTYLKFPEFKLVTTNCLTGEAEYFGKVENEARLLEICKASCSLPYGCPIVEIDGVPYLDGGISDAVPIRQAIKDGFKKNILVLTRNFDYKKKSIYNFLAPILYRKYPKLIEALKSSHEKYNESISYAESLAASGDVLIIRPQNPLEVDRLESAPQKLLALYNEGYSCAKNVIEKSL